MHSISIEIICSDLCSRLLRTWLHVPFYLAMLHLEELNMLQDWVCKEYHV